MLHFCNPPPLDEMCRNNRLPGFKIFLPKASSTTTITHSHMLSVILHTIPVKNVWNFDFLHSEDTFSSFTFPDEKSAPRISIRQQLPFCILTTEFPKVPAGKCTDTNHFNCWLFFDYLVKWQKMYYSCRTSLKLDPVCYNGSTSHCIMGILYPFWMLVECTVYSWLD